MLRYAVQAGLVGGGCDVHDPGSGFHADRSGRRVFTAHGGRRSDYRQP
jgi:hypothetical protein